MIMSNAVSKNSRTIHRRMHPTRKMAQAEVVFMQVAASCLAGHYERAVEELSALVKKDKPRGQSWEQEHLIWYFLGVASGGLEQKEEALASYKRAVELVPRHGPSLKALQRMLCNRRGRSLAEVRTATIWC